MFQFEIGTQKNILLSNMKLENVGTYNIMLSFKKNFFFLKLYIIIKRNIFKKFKTFEE